MVPQKGYIEVSSAILSRGSRCAFDIFLRAPGGFVLYAAKGIELDDKLLKGLSSAYIDSIYIKREDERVYQKFLSQNLSRIANDSSLELNKRSKIVYDSAKLVIKGLFERSDIPEAVSDVKCSAEVIMDSIFKDEKAFLSLVKNCSYDYYTYSHCINVAIYSIGIGRFLGFDCDELKLLAQGAALHDVGKSKVDQMLLNKEGKLTNEEYEHIKTHANLGFEILLNDCGEDNERILHAARHHHEKCDGTGYPDGLVGSKIDTHAKIVAIADVFDALNTERSYKKGMSTFETLSFMKTNMSAQLDMELLRAFIRCMSAK